MATGPHVSRTDNQNPIAPPDAAQTAQSEEDKSKAAEVELAKAAEKQVAASDERFLVYTVPALAASKVVSRPSGEAHAHATRADASTYANRVGVAAAMATITSQQWAALGVPDAPHTEWNLDNNWSIPVKDLADGQINYLLNIDPKYNGKRFELVDGNGQKVER